MKLIYFDGSFWELPDMPADFVRILSNDPVFISNGWNTIPVFKKDIVLVEILGGNSENPTKNYLS